jgi:hypothetical protein
MLAAIAFNENILAKLRGERRVSDVYECFSKAKGKKVTKIKKGSVNEEWKRRLVEESIDRKRRQGPGDPMNKETEDLYKELDIVIGQPYTSPKIILAKRQLAQTTTRPNDISPKLQLGQNTTCPNYNLAKTQLGQNTSLIE